MEEFISQFSSLGVIGCIGYVLLKKYLDDSKEDRRIQQEERKEDREMFKQSVDNFTKISKEYVDSINKLTTRVENVEDNTKRIEEKLDKVLEKKID